MRDITTGPNESTEQTRDAIVKLLCDELEKGLSIRVACDLVGIHDSTYYRWRREAEKGDDEAILLMRRLKAARAKGLEAHVGKIKAAADDDWRAAAWLVDKLYPNFIGQVEEIAYELAEQQDDNKPNVWSAPDRLRHIVRFAVETGVVTIEELTGIAPRPPAQRPSNQQPGSTADELERIRDAVVDELADGPRESAELRDVVCALTSCSHEQFKQACDGLEFEQQASPGRPTMVRLANPPDRSRTTPAVEQPTTEPEIRTDEPASPSANPPSQRGSWFDGPARGTGDMIRERRGG